MTENEKDQNIQGVKIQQIPMGVTAIKTGNKSFSIAMQAQKECVKHIKEINKSIPLPRHIK